MSGNFPRRLPWVGKQLVPSSSPPPLVWSFTQGRTSSGGGISSRSVPYLNPLVQGALLVCHVCWNGTGTTTMSVSDSAGNTWVQDASTIFNATDHSNLAIFHAISNGSATPTVTATVSSGLATILMCIEEYLPGSSPSTATVTVGGTNSTTFTSNTGAPSCGTIPITAAGDLTVASIAEASTSFAGTFTPGTGFTLEGQIASSAALATEYQLSTASAATGNFTTSLNRAWDAAGVSYHAQ